MLDSIDVTFPRTPTSSPPPSRADDDQNYVPPRLAANALRMLRFSGNNALGAMANISFRRRERLHSRLQEKLVAERRIQG